MKTKLPSKFYHQTEGSEPSLLDREEFFRKIKKETGATPAEMDGWFKGFLEIAASEGEFALDIPEGMEDKEDIARYKTQYAAVNKAYKAHLDIGADIVDAKAKQAKAAEARGMQIVVGAEQGRAIAIRSASHMVDGFASVIKGKFVIDGPSMRLAKGAKPTEKDFSVALGYVVNLKGAASEAADQAGFYMVDLIALADQAGFNGNELIEQIADEFGVKKFTVMQAKRVGEFWPQAKRLPGVSMSAHAEIANYAGGVKDAAKLDAVIEKVKTGIVDEITTAEGKKVKTEPKHYGAKQVRAMMQEISGKKPEKPAKPPVNSKDEVEAFLYISTDAEGNETIYISAQLSLKACADPSVTVIDLSSLTQLGSKGELAYKLETLPAEWFDAPTEVTTPKTEKKPKKEKESKAEEPKALELVEASAGSGDSSYLPE